MDNDPNMARRGNAAMIVAILAIVVSICGVAYQHWSLDTDVKSLEEARNQALSATEQAKAATSQAHSAVLQTRLSNVDRFRDHLKGMSQSLNRVDEAGVNMDGPFEVYTVVVPFVERRELERTDTSVRVEEMLAFRSEQRTRLVREVLSDAVIRMANIPSMITAITSYEAAVALEPEVADEISAMEYVILASYSHALDGVTAAERYVNRALSKFEGQAASFQKVLLYSTLAQLYYMHSPALSAEKGSEYFEAAKDLLIALPEKEKSGVIELSVWSEWAIAEYMVGRETSAERLQKQAEKVIQSIPVSQTERRELLVDFLSQVESARLDGGLEPGGPYSLGTKEIPIEQYEQYGAYDASDFGVPTPAPPAPVDDGEVSPAPAPQIEEDFGD